MKSKFLCFVVFLVALPAWAQTETPPEVSVQFRTLAWGRAVDGLSFAQKAADIPVEIMPDGRSVFYPYRGSAVVEFFRPTIGADGKPQRQVVATADLKPGGKWPLLIFLKKPGEGESYVVKVIPEDLRSFPAGSFRFLNFTHKPISAALAGESVKIQPLTDRLMEKKPAPGRSTLLCQVLNETSGKWKVLYSNNWAYSPMARTLVIASNGSSANQINVQRLAESADFSYLNPPKKTPDAGIAQ